MCLQPQRLQATTVSSPQPRTLLGAVAACALSSVLCAQITDTRWISTASGNWTVSSNWDNGVANTASTRALFGHSSATGAITVTFNATASVSGILFDQGSANYTISRSGNGSVAIQTLTVGASGIASNGGFDHTFSGTKLALALSADTSFTVGSTGNLTFSQSGNLTNSGFTLTLNGAGSGQGTISTSLQGSGDLVKADTGTWTLAGTTANTYSGLTTVNGGTLILNKNAGVTAIAGNLVVGNGAGGADTVQLNAANQIADTSRVTVAADGILNLNNYAETVGSLAGDAGGIVRLAGASNIVFAAGGDGSSTTFNGTFQDTGSGSLSISKSGAGNFTLGGASSHDGTTTVGAGAIIVKSNNALGTTVGGTVVSTGATLGFSGNVAYTSVENTTISGTGLGGNGALQNLDGVNTFAGNITLAADTTTAAATASQLTLSNRVNLAANEMSVGTATQAGGITISGNLVGTGTGTVVNVTNGTLTLANSTNSFSGNTVVANGATLVVAAGNASATTGALGAIGTNNRTTVNTGGTLAFQGGIAYAIDEAVFATGTGANANGAIQNLGGTNSFAGTITLSGATTFSAATASQLTLSGNVALGASALTVGTATQGGNIVLSGSLGGTGTGTTLTAAAGVVTLANATSSYRGDTLVGSGATLVIAAGNASATTGALGASGTGNTTTVAAGGTLAFQGGIAYGLAEAVTLAGAGVDGRGALQNLGGTNSFAGPLTLDAATTISAAAASQLTLSGAVNLGSNALAVGATGSTGNIVLSGSLAGTGTGTTLTAAAGNLTLSNSTSSYQGVTAIASGATLVVSAGNATATTGALGAAGSGNGTMVNAGGTLAFQGGIDYGLAETVALSGTGANGNGALQNLGGTNAFAGALTLGGATTASAATGSQLTLSGNIDLGANALTVGSTSHAGAIFLTGNVNGSGGLTVGGGNVTLANTTNSYSGGTTVSGGRLRVSSDSNLGAVPGSVAPSHLTLAGGALDATASFTLDANRGITLGAATTSTISADTGRTLTYGGVIAGSGNIAFGTVTTGAGNILLNAASTYSGSTTIAAGTVKYGTDNALPTGTALSLGATGTLDLGSSNATVASLSGAAGSVIDLSGASVARTLTVGNAASTTFAGAINDSGAGSSLALVKEGSGTLTLSGASSFSGNVSVNAGSLAVQHSSALGTGSGNTTVASGASLSLAGGVAVSGRTLSLSGAGNGANSGALVSTSGNNSWNGNITLTGDTTIRTNAGSGSYFDLGTYQSVLSRPPVDATTLSLASHTLTLAGGAGNSEIYLNARTSGTGGLTIDMSGTTDRVFLTSHYNTFTGATLIKNGTLVPYTLPNTFPGDSVASGGTDQFYALNGPITIGDGTGAANSAILDIRADGSRTNELLNHKVPVTLNRDGQFLVQSAQTIGSFDATINPGDGTTGRSLTFNGGNVTIGSAGALYLAGDVVVNATAGETAVISGTGNTLSLTVHQGPTPVPNANRKFTVGAGAGNTSDLTIHATINNGSLTKEGLGTMTLTGDNISGYEGTTTINNGILAITHSGALGQGLNNAASQTIVNSSGTSGTLQLSNGISVANEWLTLSGNGYGGNGALQNLSGNNAWFGPVILDSASRIQSQAGLLTVSGTIGSSNNAALDVRGAGNTTISGAIGTGNGGLTKDGTGTLILSGNSTYHGNTLVSQGVLSVQHNKALGATDGITTVAGNGAALELNNAASGNLTASFSEALVLNGTGIANSGALRNRAGDNTAAGSITIASASRINSDTNTLSLTGTVSGSGAALTIGGAGNTTHTGALALGTGALTKDGAGTFTFSGSSGTAGQTHLASGTTIVGTGAASTLNTAELSSDFSATLTIASGGTVSSVFDNGITNFNGILGGTSGGTLTLASGADSASGLKFGTSFTASNLTVKLGGSSIGGSDLNDYFRLELSGVQITVGTIHITGDTILDFNNSAGTFLTSANLIIDAGVKISVQNWVSVAGNSAASTIWYATNGANGVQGASGNLTLGSGTVYGSSPLNQVSFTNYDGLTTTWVSGTSNGWFDREIRPTPEPATYGALFLGACFGFLGWRRWSTRKRAA